MDFNAVGIKDYFPALNRLDDGSFLKHVTDSHYLPVDNGNEIIADVTDTAKQEFLLSHYNARLRLRHDRWSQSRDSL